MYKQIISLIAVIAVLQPTLALAWTEEELNNAINAAAKNQLNSSGFSGLALEASDKDKDKNKNKKKRGFFGKKKENQPDQSKKDEKVTNESDVAPSKRADPSNGGVPPGGENNGGDGNGGNGGGPGTAGSGDKRDDEKKEDDGDGSRNLKKRRGLEGATGKRDSVSFAAESDEEDTETTVGGMLQFLKIMDNATGKQDHTSLSETYLQKLQKSNTLGYKLLKYFDLERKLTHRFPRLEAWSQLITAAGAGYTGWQLQSLLSQADAGFGSVLAATGLIGTATYFGTRYGIRRAAQDRVVKIYLGDIRAKIQAAFEEVMRDGNMGQEVSQIQIAEFEKRISAAVLSNIFSQRPAIEIHKQLTDALSKFSTDPMFRETADQMVRDDTAELRVNWSKWYRFLGFTETSAAMTESFFTRLNNYPKWATDRLSLRGGIKKWRDDIGGLISGETVREQEQAVQRAELEKIANEAGIDPATVKEGIDQEVKEIEAEPIKSRGGKLKVRLGRTLRLAGGEISKSARLYAYQLGDKQLNTEERLNGQNLMVKGNPTEEEAYNASYNDKGTRFEAARKIGGVFTGVATGLTFLLHPVAEPLRQALMSAQDNLGGDIGMAVAIGSAIFMGRYYVRDKMLRGTFTERMQRVSETVSHAVPRFLQQRKQEREVPQGQANVLRNVIQNLMAFWRQVGGDYANRGNQPGDGRDDGDNRDNTGGPSGDGNNQLRYVVENNGNFDDVDLNHLHNDPSQTTGQDNSQPSGLKHEHDELDKKNATPAAIIANDNERLRKEKIQKEVISNDRNAIADSEAVKERKVINERNVVTARTPKVEPILDAQNGQEEKVVRPAPTHHWKNTVAKALQEDARRANENTSALNRQQRIEMHQDRKLGQVMSNGMENLPQPKTDTGNDTHNGINALEAKALKEGLTGDEKILLRKLTQRYMAKDERGGSIDSDRGRTDKFGKALDGKVENLAKSKNDSLHTPTANPVPSKQSNKISKAAVEMNTEDQQENNKDKRRDNSGPNGEGTHNGGSVGTEFADKNDTQEARESFDVYRQLRKEERLPNGVVPQEDQHLAGTNLKNSNNPSNGLKQYSSRHPVSTFFNKAQQVFQIRKGSKKSK